MISQKSNKQYEQRIKPIIDTNNTLSDWTQAYTNKLLSLSSQIDDGLLDISKLKLDDQIKLNNQPKKQSFFSSIPLCIVEQQTEERILNFKCNFVSQKRKDQLFKRQKKQQQEKINLRKNQIQKYYGYKSDFKRGFKGQFTLKRGDQIHTCPISSDDLLKLMPQTDLNDTIVANYLKFIQTEVLSEEVQKTTFIYSSFFFQKLVGGIFREQQPMFINQRQQKNFSQQIQIKVAQNYKNIKRWTRRVDIFEKQFLIIPINAFRHWYCAIVVNPSSLIQMKANKKPYIIYCDSMYEKRFYINDAIRMYLKIQLQDKKQKQIPIKEDNLPCYQLLLPRQTNTHDCGLYMLTYIQNLLINKHQLQNLEQIKNRQKLHMFPRSLIYSMRQRLKELFIKLCQNSDQMDRKQILKRYKEQTDKIINQADQDKDIDRINIKQFKKYESMNSHLLQNITGGQLTEQELEFACKIKFYLDHEVNFYERDRLF